MFSPFRLAVLFPLLLPVIAQADQQPRPVRVQTVVFVPSDASVTFPGTVQARVLASIAFRVGGAVTERAVNIGDRVTVGQILARLDPADATLTAQAAIQAERAAEAEALNARIEFQRYQKLGSASPAWLPTEFDRRQATLDGAVARLAQAGRQVALANDQLAYTVLRADADGAIAGLAMEIGQVVAAGQTVATLAHTAEIEVVADVPENRLADVRNATTADITLWSQPGLALKGRTREIGALADSASRTFAVKVTVLDPEAAARLALGTTAAVRFGHAGGPPVAYLPGSSIVSADGVTSVWVLDPATHRAVAHKVSVLAWNGDGQAAIGGGVADGMQVVTAGAAQLDASTPVIAWTGAIH